MKLTGHNCHAAGTLPVFLANYTSDISLFLIWNIKQFFLRTNPCLTQVDTFHPNCRSRLSSKNGIMTLKKFIYPMAEYDFLIWKSAARTHFTDVQVIKSKRLPSQFNAPSCVSQAQTSENVDAQPFSNRIRPLTKDFSSNTSYNLKGTCVTGSLNQTLLRISRPVEDAHKMVSKLTEQRPASFRSSDSGFQWLSPGYNSTNGRGQHLTPQTRISPS
jgi:hypothetical protein